eukprot:332534-Lingulodinium_polyedra.AAC.1
MGDAPPTGAGPRAARAERATAVRKRLPKRAVGAVPTGHARDLTAIPAEVVAPLGGGPRKPHR